MDLLAERPYPRVYLNTTFQVGGKYEQCDIGCYYDLILVSTITDYSDEKSCKGLQMTQSWEEWLKLQTKEKIQSDVDILEYWTEKNKMEH